MNSSVLDFLYIRIIQSCVVSLVSGQSGGGQLPCGRAVRLTSLSRVGELGAVLCSWRVQALCEAVL